MGFTDSVRKCFKNYATFDGRSGRAEFWWFYLFTALVTIVAEIPGYVLMLIGAAMSNDNSLNAVFWIGLVLLILGSLVFLAFVVPYLAVGSRRLHDRGLSAWLLLILLVPCGSIVLIVLWILEGTPGDNQYGPKPV